MHQCKWPANALAICFSTGVFSPLMGPGYWLLPAASGRAQKQCSSAGKLPSLTAVT